MSRRNDLASISMLVAGGVFGAGLMYVLDPRGGASRRNHIQGKLARGLRRAGRWADRRSRDLGNRISGAVHERWAAVRDRNIPDEILEERVHAQIGHALKHPRDVEARVRDGHVTVRGVAGRREIPKLCHRLDHTRGVRGYTIDVRYRLGAQPSTEKVDPSSLEPAVGAA